MLYFKKWMEMKKVVLVLLTQKVQLKIETMETKMEILWHCESIPYLVSLSCLFKLSSCPIQCTLVKHIIKKRYTVERSVW